MTRGSLFRTRFLVTSLLVVAARPATAQRPATVPPDTALDAYLDETARHLMLGARAARDTARMAIDSYTALMRERMGVSMSVSRRNRRLMNGESATRIRWSRDEPEIAHVLGSRLRFTGFRSGDDFGQVAVRRAADPLQDPFIFGFAVMGADSVAAAVRSPLDADSERFYQFRSGDTIVVELPGGRSVRAVTVTAIPRFRSVQLVAAVMWIEVESFGLGGIGTGEGDSAADPMQCQCFFEPPIWTLRLVRYNAREGLSVGTRVWEDMGWGKAIATARFRTAYRYPDFSVAVQHDHPQRRLRASMYANVLPFHSVRRAQWVTGDSVTIHMTRYNATTGVALQLLPGRDERNWASLRLFAERNKTLSGDHVATRTGASVRLTPWWGGLSARSVGGGGEVAVRGSVGGNPIVKASATGALTVPLGVGWSIGLEAGGGRIWGDPADHDLWLLGGNGDYLRGYSDDVVAGRSFWRARAELQRSLRFFGLSLFGDWASASGATLYSAGVGVSLVDGFIRIDLARGLSSLDGGGAGGGPGKPGWQIHWRADSVF